MVGLLPPVRRRTLMALQKSASNLTKPFKAMQAILFFLATASCASVGPDLVFQPDDPNAYLVVAADAVEVGPNTNFDFHFREVELDTKKFGNSQFRIRFGLAGSFGNDRLRIPDGHRPFAAYAGRRVKPGRFALYKVTTSTDRNIGNAAIAGAVEQGLPLGGDDEIGICFSDGAPVFDIRPGVVHVAIVPNTEFGYHPAADKIPGDIRRILKSYPGVTAEIRDAPVSATIRFEDDKNIFGARLCKADGEFLILQDN